MGKYIPLQNLKMVQYKIQWQKRQGKYVFILYTIVVLLVLREKRGGLTTGILVYGYATFGVIIGPIFIYGKAQKYYLYLYNWCSSPQNNADFLQI